MENGEVLDLSLERLGSRAPSGRKIQRCPKCGRKGEVIRYPEGKTHYTHHALRFMGLYWQVSESCAWPAEETE